MSAGLVLLSDTVIWMTPGDPVSPGFVAVDGGKIVATGPREEASVHIGPDTEVRDLGAKPIMPGFVDVHAHMEVAARTTYQTIDCRAPGCPDIPAVLDKLRAHLDDAVDGWLVGQANLFFDQKLAEKRLPTRAELDTVSTEIAIIVRAGGHVSVLNSKALELAGIDRNSQAADYSITGMPTIERDADGEPSGVVKEMDNLLPLPKLDGPGLRNAIREGVRDLFTANGVTTIGEISETVDGLRHMDALHAAGELGSRLRIYLWAPGTVSLDDACAYRDWADFTSPDDLIKIHGVKMFSDGGYSAASAAVKKPYVHLGHSHCGAVALSADQIGEALHKTAAAGLQLAIHANGDQAQEEVCEAVIAAGGPQPGAPAPRVEHAGNFLPDPSQTALWRRAGIIPVPQPVFLYTFGDFFPTYLGEYGTLGRFPFRRLVDEGWAITGSSDVWIGSESGATNPFFSIWNCLKRESFFGETIDADQEITLAEALRMHTINAAETLGEGERYGSLEAGKSADVIVLDRDPFACSADELLEVKVDEVFLAGRLVHTRGAGTDGARDASDGDPQLPGRSGA